MKGTLEPTEPLDPYAPLQSEMLLFGIDLFHHGYYWEAHEAWEALWVAAGRKGPVAELLKALIKLAAAGVKMRQGLPEGVRSHAERARQHVAQLQQIHVDEYSGFSLEQLIGFAHEVVDMADEAPRLRRKTATDKVTIVFNQPLPFVVMSA